MGTDGSSEVCLVSCTSKRSELQICSSSYRSSFVVGRKANDIFRVRRKKRIDRNTKFIQWFVLRPARPLDGRIATRRSFLSFLLVQRRPQFGRDTILLASFSSAVPYRMGCRLYACAWRHRHGQESHTDELHGHSNCSTGAARKKKQKPMAGQRESGSLNVKHALGATRQHQGGTLLHSGDPNTAERNLDDLQPASRDALYH